jgi:hypothetical protein
MEQTITGQKVTAPSKTKIIFYWVCTVLLTFELLYGATWDFNWLNKSFVRGILGHLGYPPYMDAFLGMAKIPAAIVILIPGFPLLKEWAYAGTVFLFMGAVYSHIAAGDSAVPAIFPGIYVVLGLASWALRPESRKLKLNKN